MSLMGLFSIGFIMGLTGAMAPGPLLTITIGESARRGGIVGPLVVLGHGILEFTLLVVIILGAANLLTSPVVYSFVAICGGFVLIYMGYGIIKNIKNYSLVPPPEKGKQGLHPVLIGVVVSLSNPYWFIWWITIGMGYIMFAGNLGVAGILIFFAGHILSDLVWYSFISYGIQFGGRHVSLRAIKSVLFACSMFLIIFGLLFIIKGYNFIR
jgi:threonine/homoserine/homoserine lactone efflux protein